MGLGKFYRLGRVEMANQPGISLVTIRNKRSKICSRTWGILCIPLPAGHCTQSAIILRILRRVSVLPGSSYWHQGCGKPATSDSWRKPPLEEPTWAVLNPPSWLRTDKGGDIKLKYLKCFWYYMVIIGFYLILWKNVAASQVIKISKIYVDFEIHISHKECMSHTSYCTT